MTEFALKMQSDEKIRNSDYQLHFAAFYHDFEAIKEMIVNNADVNKIVPSISIDFIEIRGKTPLECAVGENIQYYNNDQDLLKIAELFINAGSNIYSIEKSYNMLVYAKRHEGLYSYFQQETYNFFLKILRNTVYDTLVKLLDIPDDLADYISQFVY